eukprot:5972081-Amphidinium_carterae.3
MWRPLHVPTFRCWQCVAALPAVLAQVVIPLQCWQPGVERAGGLPRFLLGGVASGSSEEVTEALEVACSTARKCVEALRIPSAYLGMPALSRAAAKAIAR